jgi:N-acetylglucosaminyl-diphospho-decaprenol L-rhamnosyltransferase
VAAPRHGDHREGPEVAVTPDASVVIVNWNGGDLLARALGSVRESAPAVVVELVLVDNASTDDSVTQARAGGGVTVIRNPENLGFARASNQGIRESRGRHVVLLNPDAELLPGALETLVGYMDREPRVGAAGPALLNPDGSLQPSGWPFPQLPALLAIHPALRWLARDEAPRNGRDRERPADVDEVSGACMILRRAALDGIGLFDERFFLYFEDVDLCLRLRRAGWRVAHVPAARVVHHWRSRTDPSPDAQLHHLRSKLRYVRKHFGPLACLALRALGVGVYTGLVVRALLRRVSDPSPERRRALGLSTRLLKACVGR